MLFPINVTAQLEKKTDGDDAQRSAKLSEQQTPRTLRK
jgi:hypothetical protein